MKLGFQLPYFDWPGAPETTAPKLREIAEAVEALSLIHISEPTRPY